MDTAHWRTQKSLRRNTAQRHSTASLSHDRKENRHEKKTAFRRFAPCGRDDRFRCRTPGRSGGDYGQDSDMTAFYQEWKSKYVRQNPYVTDETQYYVYYSEDTYSGGEPVPVTVSEAHGYGMLIAVSMADYDPDARAIFDGMVRYYQAHPSEIGLHLMAWQQSDNGSL